MTDNQHSMPFLDHLEELRWRLVKSLGSVLVGAVITFFFIDQVIDFLIKPTQDLDSPMDLQVLKVQGMFMIKWGIAMLGGVVLSIPVLTYQLWKFIAPGLYLNEKKYIAPLIIFTYLSFLIGLIFAYTVIIPFSLNFFTSVGMSGIQNNFSINYYFNFITWLLIGSGFIFELPVLVFILSIIGLLTPVFMGHYRRHSFITILVLSAFITPPDPVSLILMSIPLMALYEISIGVSWLVNRKKLG
ncbi:MAG: twin-arginine translocase subunit TatC [Candidatus Marinimicrobia bacterium]|nr:twin-arginine translocase subunit TatC [Candidatus Neomarinimicrobiota bacterium]